MDIKDNLALEMDKLNPEQRRAVEIVDGPLLVVAGPGTGKTQLLSLRAANILATRDVLPKNILCLTYTEAGAEAMRKRLIQLIGRDGYGIEVSTFHSFCQSIRSQYPQYFKRNPAACPASDLQRSEILNQLLRDLPFNTPLSGSSKGVATALGACKSFIGKLQRSGLSSDDYRNIMEQNLAAIAYLSTTPILSLVSQRVPSKVSGKEQLVEALEAAARDALREAPAELKQPVVSTTGVYVPFLTWFVQQVLGTEMFDEEGKFTGFQEFRKSIFEGRQEDGMTFKDEKVCRAGAAAADIMDGYHKAMEECDFYDFDDMISDCIQAMEENEDLRQELQQRFRYIQVDEFQDTNSAQMHVVDLLCQGLDEPNIMAVGDDDQAIMRFQGASVVCIEQFQEKYEPVTVVLKANYRSTPALVELGQKVAKQVGHRLSVSEEGKDIFAHNQESEQIEFIEDVFPTPEEQYLTVAKEIRELLDSGFLDSCAEEDKGIAVLAYKHQSLRSLIPYLKALDIPFSYRETSELSSMECMQTLLGLIRFAVAYGGGHLDQAQAFLPGIIAAPELGGDHEESVAFAVKACQDYHRDWIGALQDTSSPRLKSLWGQLVQWAAEAPSRPVRQLIFDMARPCIEYYRGRQEEDPLVYAEFNSGIRALISFVEEETGGAQRLGHALRLADVVDRLDKAKDLDVSIEAGVSMDAPGAVRLTSAHSSKGLEFDQVFIVDASDSVWHGKGNSRTNVYPPNLLIGDEHDEDDACLLLFVAITRAKRFLHISRAAGDTLRELQGLVESRPRACEPDELAQALMVSWRDDYALDTPALKALALPRLEKMSLSASALNDFVDYEEGCTNSRDFPAKRILRLPDEPSIILEFGTKVHSFFEEYVKQAAFARPEDAKELEKEYEKILGWLDYEPAEVSTYIQRFRRICSGFLPWMNEQLSGALVTEAKLSAVVGDDVPLFGYCDLLMVDTDKKEIKVVDYKTGFKYPGKTPTLGYERQLRFYRLLVENSPEYQGYTVESVQDWYVEPEKGTRESVHQPVVGRARDEDLDHLKLLINAVWHRIQRQDYDTTGFEGSAHKASALAQANEKNKKRLVQAAYEDWLIDEDQQFLD